MELTTIQGDDMFRSIRRFPLLGLAVFGLGFLLATALAGSATSTLGSAVGFAFFLPFLILKVMFMFFLFGMLLRFAGRGWGGGWSRGAWSQGGPRQGHGGRPGRHGSDDETQWRYRGRPMRPTPPAPSPEQAEWKEHLRQARREVDDLDAPYDDVDGNA